MPGGGAEAESRRLFLEATDLAIGLQEDPSDPAAIAGIRAWIATSPAHRQAWDRVVVIQGLTASALKPGAGGKGVSRRQLLSLAGIGLGGLALGGLIGPGILLRLRADHLTGTATLAELDLPDGSRVTLGPDSALALDFTPGTRGVELLQGMAYFEILSEPQRDFRVRSGAISAHSQRSGFEISIDAGQVSLAVDHGHVEAEGPEGRLSLAAGDWLGFDRRARPLPRGRRGEGEVAAWRSGLLIAEAESVQALVARIARWQPGTVILADPGLGARVVSGVFDLRDPLAALAMVVEPFGGRVRRLGPGMTVISSI